MRKVQFFAFLVCLQQASAAEAPAGRRILPPTHLLNSNGTVTGTIRSSPPKVDNSWRETPLVPINIPFNKKENYLNRADCVYFVIEMGIDGKPFHSAVATPANSPINIADAWGKGFVRPITKSETKIHFWSFYRQSDAERAALDMVMNPQEGTWSTDKNDTQALRKIYECCGYALDKEKILKNLSGATTGHSATGSVSGNCAGNIIYGFQGEVLGNEWDNDKAPEKTDGLKKEFWEVRALDRMLQERAKTEGSGGSCHLIHDESNKIKNSPYPFGYDSENEIEAEYDFLPIAFAEAPADKGDDAYANNLICNLMCSTATKEILHVCSVNRFMGNFRNPPLPQSVEAPLTYSIDTFLPDRIISQQKFYPANYPKDSSSIPTPCKEKYEAALKEGNLEFAFQQRFGIYKEAENKEKKIFHPYLSTPLLTFYRDK